MRRERPRLAHAGLDPSGIRDRLGLMRHLFVAVLALSSVALSSCGKDMNPSQQPLELDGDPITRQFLSKWTGTFRDENRRESLVIASDGSFEHREYRQVGTAGGAIPYPTTCNFVEKGKISEVIARSSKARSYYTEFATHVIIVQISEVTLLDDLHASSGDSACQEFRRQRMAAGAYVMDYYAEVPAAGQIRLHTSGGADFVPGGTRTPSTLDEIYTRVAP